MEGRARSLARRLRHVGRARYCPCCSSGLRGFIQQAGPAALVCPVCGSRPRQRVLCLYLKERAPVGPRNADVLHFAPEPALETPLRKAAGSYVSVDIDRSRSPSVVADITELPLDDASFDLVLCSHVLEHVSDDGRAMREMNRVLRPTGIALIQSPVNYEQEETLEDPGVTSPEEREKLFSQPDHVRVYGRDLRGRLEAAGFVVDVDFYAGELSQEEATRQGLLPTFGPLRNDLYVCRRRD